MATAQCWLQTPQWVQASNPRARLTGRSSAGEAAALPVERTSRLTGVATR